MTEFLEMRPSSLDFSAEAKAGTTTPEMEATTLGFNPLLIERLHQQGFSFKVMGVRSAAEASSSWLQAELGVLEKLNVKWEAIPRLYVNQVKTMPKWR